MTPDRLVARLESLDLPNSEFRHEQHLESAFFYIRRDGLAAGEDALLRALAAFARHHGHPERFHVSLTVCWVRLVAAAMSGHPECGTSGDLTSRHPALLDKELPLRFYSRPVLFSALARETRVEPDKRPLPPAHLAPRSR